MSQNITGIKKGLSQINLPTYLLIKYVSKKVFLIKPDAKKNPPGDFELITGGDLIKKPGLSRNFVGINTKHFLDNEFLVDIDFPKNDVNTVFLKEKLKKFIIRTLNVHKLGETVKCIQTTKHGFHIFCQGDFFITSKTVYSNLGIKFEVFSNRLNANSNLTIAGANYGLFDEDKAINLLSLEEEELSIFFNPLENTSELMGNLLLPRETHIGVNADMAGDATIPPKGVIQIGQRNNQLYLYAKIYKNKELVCNLNEWATQEPISYGELSATILRDELYEDGGIKGNEGRVADPDNLNHLVSTEDSESKNDTLDVLDPTMLDKVVYNPLFNVHNLPIDAKIIFLFLKGSKLAGQLVYIDSFYIFQGIENNLWKKDSGDYINQKAVSLMLQQSNASLAGYIMYKKKTFFDKLADFVKIMAPNFTKKSAFIGKTIDIQNKRVYHSKKEDYLTNILPYKLKRGSYKLDPYFLAVISAICGYSSERINLLRLALNKLIFPDKESQQIVYIYGGPKTGKSSIADFIKTIHEDDMKAANFEALSKPFEASNLIHLKIIYIGDVTYLKNVSELKKWQGRDFIQTERKFEHTNVSNCFSGTIFITSNYPPEKALGLINDEALSSRILAVPLEFVVVQDNPYFEGPFNLTKFLQTYREDVIYWALTVPEKLREQPRVDLFKYSGSESCYGTFKTNLIYGNSPIPININKIGPVRQFLEERVKLSEQLKPLQKTVGYLFSKTINTVAKNYFNKRLPTYGIKDFKTESFRLSILDRMYVTEFFDREDGYAMQGDKRKPSYSHCLNNLLQETLFEVYYTYTNPYKSPFPETFIHLINPLKISTFYEDIGDNQFLNAMKDEYSSLGKKKKLAHLSGKDLFFEYLNWLPVKPSTFYENIGIKNEFYAVFLDEVLVNLKGLFKYPFESTIRNKEGVSFLGIEWRNKESWKVMRESGLLRQYDPFMGEWMGVFEDDNREYSWEILVEPCDSDKKHSLVQIDISFAEYFRCPATFAILEQFNSISWVDYDFIHANLSIQDKEVHSINNFAEDLEDAPQQIVFSNYLDDNYEKVSPVSREYLLRSFIFHSGLIANRFDEALGESGSYLQSFTPKVKEINKHKGEPKAESASVFTNSATPFTNSATPFTNSATPFTNSATPFTDSATPFTDSATPFLSNSEGASPLERRNEGLPLVSNDIKGHPFLEIETPIKAKETQYFPYNLDSDNVSMQVSGFEYTLFKEYADQRKNFLKNFSWVHAKENYLRNLKHLPDTFSNREKFFIDFKVLNFDFSNMDYVSLEKVNSYSNVVQITSALRHNWEQLKDALEIGTFLSAPAPYYPETQYRNLKSSLMLRPLMICFWENSLGQINRQLNKLFSEEFLTEVQKNVKKLDSNTQVGRRWADQNRDFSAESFLPESAFYTLNNFDYGRLKFGKFYLKKLKTKNKPSVTGPYAAQHNKFKMLAFKAFLSEKSNFVGFLRGDEKLRFIYVLDIDLNKAHSNISYGLTQSRELLAMEELLKTEKWEGIYAKLNCPQIDTALADGSLNFDTIKKAIKGFYYKGIQGGNLNTLEGVSRTLEGKDPDKEPPHKFSSDKSIDRILKSELCKAWFTSPFNNGLKAFPVKIDSIIKSKGLVHLPLLEAPIDYNFTKGQTKKGSSNAIRVVSDVLTNIEFIQVVKIFDILFTEFQDEYFIPLLYEADGISVLYCSYNQPDLKDLENQINTVLNHYGLSLYRGESTVGITVLAEKEIK